MSPHPLPIDGEAWLSLQAWLPDNDDPERPTMTLSTVTGDGLPDARTVLLSGYERDGFSFHTDARSRKVEQLVARPVAALTLVWPERLRQLVVQAATEPTPVEEVVAAYRARTPYLRQLAWLNTPEFATLPHAERVRRWQAFAQEHPDLDDPPPTWVGFLARPTRLSFWSGDPDTASRRVEYTVGPEGWAVRLLPG